jgi:hypothetical protein
VKVILSASNECFVVHEELLTCYSRFFRAAFDGKFKEAKEKKITLEWSRGNTVEFCMHWLYHQRFLDKIPSEYPDLAKQWSKPDDACACNVEQLVHLYVFADKYEIPKLRHACIDEFYLLFEGEATPALATAATVRIAYENLSANSPLCRLLVELHCRHDDKSNYGNAKGFEKQAWPNEFLVAVMKRYCEVLDHGLFQEVEEELDLCKYHEHTTNEERETCVHPRLSDDSYY